MYIINEKLEDNDFAMNLTEQTSKIFQYNARIRTLEKVI